MMSIEPESLLRNYSKFLRPDRILLTGHSHQAWPDVAAEGVLEALADAASFVDDKWSRAFEKANLIRSTIAEFVGVEPQSVALGQNTHELFYRFISALDPSRRHLVLSDGEFHSVKRQVLALASHGWRVTWVPTNPVQTLSERLVDAIEDDTAAVVCSTVLFETGAYVPHLPQCVEAARRKHVEVFLDGYHGFMVRPFGLGNLTAKTAFVSGGGYKYAQWGEGACWLTIPEHHQSKPMYTGWFSDFGNLDCMEIGEIGYGQTPSDRFAGSTYDPISHYRAARVIQFFREHQLSPERLGNLYENQTQRLIDGLGTEGLCSPLEPSERGGFVAYRVHRAGEMVKSLRRLGIFADSRGQIIRFGAAPYLTMDEIERATDVIFDLMREERNKFGSVL